MRAPESPRRPGDASREPADASAVWAVVLLLLGQRGWSALISARQFLRLTDMHNISQARQKCCIP